ncbi:MULTISPECIES: hypothetical protein [unclassified Lentimonas]|uniref:hypothetical protein n=1 Tax=unclassified Lentimonas TaxID=2630993 RepID=UPI00132C65AB|nr:MULTISPECIES: hypothetical protein [unclassified Lentimonas]CAA6693216.1 Unannotated [Lentimonas sp. CC10]CAA6695492.1 Unannotated [Lentimonas sp. CC19]CAA7071741.1 Unannotated [Lentimonas sp. CC11]
MKTLSKLSAFALIALGLFALTGCEDNNLEDAADEIGDAMEKGVDNVKDAGEDAADAIKDATN